MINKCIVKNMTKIVLLGAVEAIAIAIVVVAISIIGASVIMFIRSSEALRSVFSSIFLFTWVTLLVVGIVLYLNEAYRRAVRECTEQSIVSYLRDAYREMERFDAVTPTENGVSSCDNVFGNRVHWADKHRDCDGDIVK